MSALSAIGIALAAIGLSSVCAYAGPIGLDHTQYPDVYVAFAGGTYRPASHTFDVNGIPETLTHAVVGSHGTSGTVDDLFTNSAGVDTYTGTYSLHAIVDANGVVDGAHSYLNITDANGATVLHGGALQAFGWSLPTTVGNPFVFEFTFTALTGYAAPEYGSPVGVIYTAWDTDFIGAASFAGTVPFTTDGDYSLAHNNPDVGGLGAIDNRELPVPEPASLGLLGLGALALVLRRRTRN